MTGQDFVDEIDCASFFDHIDDLVEFPPVSDTALNSVGCDGFPNIWTGNSDELQVSDPIFSGSNSSNAAALSAELAVPYEDIVQLEWLSTFVEDSFSGGGMTMSKDHVPVKKEPLMVPHHQFQSSSPVSVLESSSSSSSSSSCSGNGGGSKMIPLSPTHRGGTQRARSKRPRPATFNPRSVIELLSPMTLVPVPVTLESEHIESHFGLKSGNNGPDHQKKKRKKIKKSEAQVGQGKESENQNQNQHQAGQGVRKCLHCEITKTPQWRAGPMGPKTLCNACGVRYKSGRLFPEYRPAASPTFVPSLHSNSHKKVVEMRTKGAPAPTAIMETKDVSPPDQEHVLIPNVNPSADGM